MALRFAIEGFKYSSTFLHPRLERHRSNSPLWRRRQETNRPSQPYPGVLRRGNPGRYSFTFVGGVEAGGASTQVEEVEAVEAGAEEQEALGALGFEYLDGDSQMEDDEDGEADTEVDYLDRENLLAWMCRESSEASRTRTARRHSKTV